MSIFDWFSGNSSQASSASGDEHAAAASRKKPTPLPFSRPAPEPAPRSDNAKLRHSHRDQLFVSIREAMTRAGVLSGSYKFKVLSLDQEGGQFLVMMDMVTVAGDPPPRLEEIEALIAQTAKTQFDITVSAVYWRLAEKAAASKFVPPPMAAVMASVAQHPIAAAPLVPAAPPEPIVPTAPPAKPSASRFEPILPEEVSAFQRALLVASALGTSMSIEKGVKVRSGLRTSATDFEDTELTESTEAPVLSATQYGDLM